MILIRKISIQKTKTTGYKNRTVLVFYSIAPITEQDREYIKLLEKEVSNHGIDSMRHFKPYEVFSSSLKEYIYEFDNPSNV